MLLKYKESFKFILLFIVFAGILFACGKSDNPVVDPTDDIIVDPVDDDPNPTGFLGEVDFIKTYGGSDEDVAIAVVQSNDGNYLVLGSTKSVDGDLTGRPDQGNDYWLLKIDPNGAKIWSKTYGGSEDDVASSLVKTNDGGYIISGYSRSSDGDISENAGFQDFWLVKTDSSGNIQWEKTHGFPGSDQAFKIFETSEGNFFATGFFDVGACGVDLCDGNDFQGNIDANRAAQHGVGEFWGILMDASGNKIWRRYFGGSLNDRAYDALQTNDGGFLLAGQSESFDFDITDDKGSYDFWLVRLDANGNKLWTKSFGGSEIDQGYAVTKTPDGNYIMVGDTRSIDQDVSSSHGGGDAWAIKFNDSGNKIWEKTYGGSAFDSARSIKPLANGGYLISGFTRSTDGDVTANYGENELWVFMINENGVLTFQKSFGGSALDFGYSAIQTTDNKVLLVGNTESIDFDIPLNRGIKDLIVIKLK